MERQDDETIWFLLNRHHGLSSTPSSSSVAVLNSSRPGPPLLQTAHAHLLCWRLGFHRNPCRGNLISTPGIWHPVPLVIKVQLGTRIPTIHSERLHCDAILAFVPRKHHELSAKEFCWRERLYFCFLLRSCKVNDLSQDAVGCHSWCEVTSSQEQHWSNARI